MFKITKGKGYTLQELHDKLTKYLNPQQGKVYTDKSLIKKVSAMATNPMTKTSHLPFYKYLEKNDYRVLKELLNGTPKQLAQKIKDIDKRVASGEFPKFFELGANNEKKSTVFGAEVLKLFKYKNFRGTKVYFDLYKAMDRKYCNYCNLDTTLSIDTGQSLFDCDHYFTKVEYPYLSVSFYNLISSCTVCNTRLKTAKALDLKDYPHPYIDEVHDYIRFTTDKPLDIGNNIDDFKITVKKKKVTASQGKKGVNLVGFFSVDKRYSELPKDAKYLFEMSKDYSITAKQEMYDEQAALGLPVTKDDIIATIKKKLKIPSDTDDAANTAMGKLQLDLAEEFLITTPF
jgi:hypothetical protein